MNKQKDKTKLDSLTNTLTDSPISSKTLADSESLLSKSTLTTCPINSAISVQNASEVSSKYQTLFPKTDNNLSNHVGLTTAALLSSSSSIKSINTVGINPSLLNSNLNTSVQASVTSLQSTIELMSKSPNLLPKFDNNLSNHVGLTTAALLSSSSSIKSINTVGINPSLLNSNLNTSVQASVTSLQSTIELMSKSPNLLPKFDNNLSNHVGLTTSALLSSSSSIKSINTVGINPSLLNSNLNTSVHASVTSLQSTIELMGKLPTLLPKFDNNLSTYANTLSESKALATSFSKLATPYFPTMLANNALFGLAEQASYAKTLKFAAYAEKSVLGITTENFGSKINIEQINKNHIRNAFSTLTGSYSAIMKSVENPILYRQLDTTVSKLTPIEYFSTANLLESISIDEKITIDEEVLKSEIIYENEISLCEYLPKFDPGLYNMWKGAIESLNSKNSDKIRQFITSIRELFTHLFQMLAPDKDIKTWTIDPSHFHNGRATRKTRLLYIFRNINDRLFADFLQKDIETTIALIDVFQKGTHSVNSSFTEYQLIAIKSKSESTLKFLLELHFKINP